jgi:hypothetical protein
MAPKHHPTPLSGGDRKALAKELGRARAMTTILAGQAAEARTKGEALIRQADKLLCESWNERMWADGRLLATGQSVRHERIGSFAQRLRHGGSAPAQIILHFVTDPADVVVFDLRRSKGARKCCADRQANGADDEGLSLHEIAE